ncbi:hypothetical protein F4561_003092 [Lipingzhangella halophila]|uniref:Uncharacterized protein n=1 Tax=Lipingzhangella halophila TaxID=1783352 RepID=A0A7W7RI20_9ACTN|nr:hypothetical protein [Lipingzhangella halophila]MBB4932272.1 hypothetical protein [Lipingzhangella halophila]
MPSDRILPTLDLDAEVTALCLEERPQLFTLAAVDHEANDGGVIGWILAWKHRVVVYWDGRSNVTTYRTLAEFWKQASEHERSNDVRIIPMDGQPIPDLD